MKIINFYPSYKEKEEVAPLYSGVTFSQLPYDENRIEKNSSDEIEINKIIDENESLFKGATGILISPNCRLSDILCIICSIRLSSNAQIASLPIAWCSFEPLEDVICKFPVNGKSVYLTESLFFIYVDSYTSNGDRVVDIVNSLKNAKVGSLNDINLSYVRKSAHEVTNEWGAYILAFTAGFYDLLPKITEMKHAKSLYFKYLVSKSAIQIPKLFESRPESEIKKHYLLIDDNYLKGWELVFAAILGKDDSSLGLECYTNVSKIESDESGATEEIINQIYERQYQGVLLDLRLTDEDNGPDKSHTNIKNFSGGRILEKLKNSFPYLPVIIVTASNKAWNMQQLLDLGADGYFIKESPEFDIDRNVSISNYGSFVNLLSAMHEKFEILSPFWHYIVQINQQNLIKEKTFVDGTLTKVKSRISERLKMFFGLLKRNFEDSFYNKQNFYFFFISLAFMTLWSCLNDIQYVYYKKTVWITSSNKQKENIQIEGYLLNRSEPVFLQKRHNQSNKVDSYITCNHDQNGSPHFILQDGEKDLSQSIGEQIAFLLIHVGTLSPSHHLVENLYALKEKRNKNYFTHGNELSSSNFYKYTESEQNSINIDDCKRLFEIIYFLLKKVEIRLT